jgi:L-2-aminoadipate reductase
MKENRVTVTHLTPAMGQILVGGATARIASLRNAFFVGDLLTKKDTTKLRDLAPNTTVINLYGSTESQRAVSFFEIPSKTKEPQFLDDLPDIIPVGQGMLNVQLLVVDREDKMRLCEVGEQGELLIRAGGLAEGYLGDDEKTVELNRSKFLTNWFVDPEVWTRQHQLTTASEPPRPWAALFKGPRDRLYKTGDLGRRRKDGSVECTGRIDSQVKIRGFRIELGEIDTHLSQHPYVRENVTLVRRDKDEEHKLVTYFVPETKRWFEHSQQRDGRLEIDSQDESMGQMLRRFRSLSEDCKKFLAAKVPKYAVPSLFIPLARMPLSEYSFFPSTHDRNLRPVTDSLISQRSQWQDRQAGASVPRRGRSCFLSKTKSIVRVSEYDRYSKPPSFYLGLCAAELLSANVTAKF